MRIRIAVVISGVIVLAIGLFTVFGFWKKTPSNLNANPQKLTVGVGRSESTALVYIAREGSFFKKRGLEVTVKDYEAGVHAVNDLLAEKLHVATAAEFVLVLRSFQTDDLRILASIGSTDNCYLIAKKNGAIKHPKDLKGKRIATVRGSGLDFFLGRFLSFNGVPPESVQRLDFKPSESFDALLKNRVDAVACFGPYSSEFKKSLGEKALAWPLQGGQDFYFLAISKENFIKSRAPLIERFLIALTDAEEFFKNNEQEAHKIIARCLNVDESYLKTVLPQSRLTVRLDQSLLILMEDEARWAIRNRITDKKEMPNYFHSVYLDGLKKVKPEGVTIIH